MDIFQIAVRIGEQEFTWAEVLAAAAGLAFLLLVVTAIFAWRAGRTRRDEALEAMRRAGELEVRLAEMAGQLRQFAESTSVRDAHLTRTLDERLDNVGRRLGHGLNESSERTNKSLKQLHERIAVIDSAQANITALSSEMINLKDILSNKQTRGAFGEARMEAIICDGLHASAYQFQPTLSNKMRPDCLIKLPENDVRIVVDAKFPLEAYSAHIDAEGDDEIRQAEQRLRRDVLHHIKQISSKYLIAGETHETAIMFVPSESVYAHLYEHFDDIIQKAHRARVVIASPNVLMLLVQTMQAIFKDARMREQAGLIQKELVRLLEDVDRLNLRTINLRKHFDMANRDINELEVSSAKITKRGQKIEQLELSETRETGEIAADTAQPKPKLVAGE